MVKKLVGAGIFMLVGAIALYYALSHHFVTTETKTVVVSKAELSLSKTFVDIRQWSLTDYKDNLEVTKAIYESSHKDVLPAEVSALFGLFGKGKEILGID